MKHLHFRDGRLVGIDCPECGKQIANEVTVDQGGLSHRVLSRGRQYAEIKIRCADGSFHVANGCVDCLSGELTSEDLTRIIRADRPDDRRTGIEVVAFEKGNKGIM